MIAGLIIGKKLRMQWIIHHLRSFKMKTRWFSRTHVPVYFEHVSPHQDYMLGKEQYYFFFFSSRDRSPFNSLKTRIMAKIYLKGRRLDLHWYRSLMPQSYLPKHHLKTCQGARGGVARP